MNEVFPGIISLDGFKAEGAGDLVVAVHPFYDAKPEGYGNNPEKIDKETEFLAGSGSAYLRKLEDFYRDHEGPIVTLEEADALGHTIGQIHGYGCLHNRYFIETLRNAPDPSSIGWEEVMRFLKRFNRTPKAIGGELSYHRKSEHADYGGRCLGNAIEEISHGLKVSYGSVKLIEELVFVYP